MNIYSIEDKAMKNKDIKRNALKNKDLKNNYIITKNEENIIQHIRAQNNYT